MNERSEMVKLVFDRPTGEDVGYEMVPAERTGKNRYRLTGSPGFAPGVASGDEIELAPSGKLGYRVVERSGNVCVQLFLHQCSERDKREIAKMADRAGGMLEGGMDSNSLHVLVIAIHASKGFDAIERLMDAITARFDVDTWMYGNVYDPEDGETPLGWWE